MYKFWSKASITKKVFFCLSVIFLICFFISFLGQILFYGGIYTYYQKQGMIKGLKEFTEEYENLDDFDEINSSIVDYSNENGSYIMIMSERGDILHSLSYDMTLYDAYGQMYRFSLDKAVNDQNFADLGLEVGDTVTVKYSSMLNEDEYKSFYNPERIIKNGTEWEIKDKHDQPEKGFARIPEKKVPMPHQIPDFEDMFPIHISYEVSGIITKIDIPNDFDLRNSIKRNESTEAIIKYIMENIKNKFVMQEGKDYIYIYETNNDRYMVIAQKIKHNDEVQYIYMVNTLKSMDQAISIMKRSYKIWLFAAFFPIMIIAFVFSSIITKPLKNMSVVTKNLKNLDFSKKCAVNSQDELGELAQDINDMSDKLNDTIQELTEANAKLKSDIEREREIENQRREFIAAVSHELKTPLAIIRAYAESIEDGFVSAEKQEKYLKIIVGETEKMNKLVNDMLNNSKLESGTMVMDIKNHNLSDFVRKISAKLSQNAKEKGIEISNNIQENLYADFDKYYLEQVVSNFITNAIRHTPENMKIYVNVFKENDYYEVSVENEGSHIDEDDLSKVWNRFYKVDKSRTGEGTGLGLSIAKNILTLHKAEYSVENTDRGVKFKFRLSDGGNDE